MGLKFFERVGSEDKLYDFIVEADPVKAIGSDRFARDFRSFRRHSEKGSSALIEMMAPRRRTIETSALEAEFLAGTLSNCNLLAVSIGTPVRDSRYVLSSFDALCAPLPAALVDCSN